MPVPFIIAIDGHSSCGKSTLARAVAGELGFIYIDSGAMYRAVTFYFLKKNIDLQDNEAVKAALDQINIELKAGQEGMQVFLNGRDITGDIRKMPVSNLVSKVSAIPEVRDKMVKLQRDMGKKENLVMDGRDIGTVVFPQASLKIFMTADPGVRARRRYEELRAKGLAVSLEEIHKNLLKRDHEDTTRAWSPLLKAPDALELDNSCMSREEQLSWIMKKIKERL
ncbi:cytidylate kinase [Anseongella ginsenosidimutans]|uniref:Cytidylate kinase n=1 Tax=Anseongella ginsenosidimutans TaxID=496056 RepID=A0A4R3KMT0_9SPHI|nr:(d)CMP kinase [Anseongella ginsenosidimutans]QEC52738.1 (d)CMP kinase [Anseongella ginsenosidimutans]TCS85494.1 cytidylate kinase [Anseongella ginsenosidimutans]